jgi:diguanylate cyclase (GGDEF)-like protein
VHAPPTGGPGLGDGLLFERHPDPMWVIEASGRRILAANDAAVAGYGWSREELLALRFDDLLVAPRAGGEGRRQRHRRKDGTVLEADVVTAPIRWEGGEARLVTARDVTDRAAEADAMAERLAYQEAVARLGELALRGDQPERLTEEALADVVAALGADVAALWLLAPDGRLALAGAQGLGEPPAPATPPAAGPLAALLRGQRRSLSAADIAPLGITGAAGIAVPIHGAGGPRGVLVATTREPRVLGEAHVVFLEGVATVLALAGDRWALEEDFRRRAFHDVLTGLPNRALFLDRLELALQRARRTGDAVVVVFLDLDGFKAINDRHGHTVGDEVLVAVGARLLQAVRPQDTVARFGGDEFALICEIDGPARAGLLARRIAASLDHPFRLDGAERVIGASVGLAVGHGDDERTAEDLVRDADAEMYRYKARRAAA